MFKVAILELIDIVVNVINITSLFTVIFCTDIFLTIVLFFVVINIIVVLKLWSDLVFPVR